MARALQLRFTKGSGKMDRLEIIRTPGRREVIDCPKQGIIPHDMMHFAVESVLDAKGFLGRVRDGEEARLQMQGEPGSDGVERLVEVVQADQWSGGSTPAAQVLELYAVTCEARRCPPLPIDEATIAAISERVRELTQHWSTVAVGGVLELVL